jgi:hypothetical protein
MCLINLKITGVPDANTSPQGRGITFMKDYYFKYVVWDHAPRQFSRFKPASRYAKKLNEKVLLTTFSKSNTFNEPYDDQVIQSVDEIAPARKILIASFYKITETQPMSRKDYRFAYRFLKIRATMQGELEPFRSTVRLPYEQQERIYKFLSYNHQVKFI